MGGRLQMLVSSSGFGEASTTGPAFTLRAKLSGAARNAAGLAAGLPAEKDEKLFENL